MPTFVISASVYVDNVATPEEATRFIESLNIDQDGEFVRAHIRLPDSANELDSMGSHWEESGSTAED